MVQKDNETGFIKLSMDRLALFVEHAPIDGKFKGKSAPDKPRDKRVYGDQCVFR